MNCQQRLAAGRVRQPQCSIVCSRCTTGCGGLPRQHRRSPCGGSTATPLQCSAASVNAAASDPLAAPAELPLWGRRVLVTGPRQYAGRLAAPLAAAGARVITLPCIAIRSLDDLEQLQELDAALFSLDSFHHIAFTSRNAVSGTLARLAALHSAASRSTAAEDPSSGSTGGSGGSGGGAGRPSTTIEGGSSRTGGSSSAGGSGGAGSSGVDFGGKAAAALGSCGATLWALGADTGALRDAGVENVRVPEESSTQGLVAAMAREGVAGQRVLCLVPHVAPPLVEPPIVPRFLEALQRAGAVPVRAPAYVTATGLPPLECLTERDMLERGAISAIAFSSQAEAQGLLHAMGGNAEALAATLRSQRVLLAAHGPYTAAGVTQTLGVPVDCVSQDFSCFDGVVAALSRHYQH